MTVSQKKKLATALVLRSCRADLTSYGDFQWPGVGETATAPDWSDNADCGQGLHGFLYGQGDHDCSSFTGPDCKWLVVEVEEAGIIMLGGKCKFQSGVVRFVGDKKDATDYLMANEQRSLNVAIIGATRSVGDNQAVIVGALGTATAGYSGTATAGARGTAKAGEKGEIRIQFYDRKNERYRTKIAYVGEGGILADTFYRLNDNNEFEVANG